MSTKINIHYFVMPGMPVVNGGGIELVVRFVSESIGVSVKNMHSKYRTREFAQARNMCYFFMLYRLNMTCTAIAKYFNRDHTTILHGIKMHKIDVKDNYMYAEKYETANHKLRIYQIKPKQTLYA